VKSIGKWSFANCMGLKVLSLEGNAPVVGDYAFYECSATARVYRASTGWGVSIPGTWKGLRIEYIDEIDEPIPDLGDNPAQEQIREALEDSADSRLAECITNSDSYAAYRAWAASVKGDDGQPIGALAVKNSSQAWLSFALDSDKLIDDSQTNAAVTVEAFTPTTNVAEFAFTVSVENIVIGDKASEENLKQVFGLEGGTSLEALSPDDVDITFDTPVNGKVKFTAGPKDTTVKQFFMKVKLDPLPKGD